ncbi:hypothetical protein PC129_g7290 [Phytophthora cactorum]|uniref:Uncharacterized protein n=1 Tax=Phytophthora cactorum TaxID=29920 RepID=A0A8T1KYN3_9STRA|nr:hypothetical protein Pcac1_g6583 [Phytophthora cactorum]KAG2828607.1 hypothetical protein PC112_g8397 [Phytophthora cactorum]KAG2847292.1 hypothetical protein PC111_g883 [Phytophthora cactorum]KAG2861390.1 hypothetical protein PC113_g7221 [Phytophthora cactorum]KAG2916846.1 hypothetical protein PC114_g7346 [Phytophthora cactorum]
MACGASERSLRCRFRFGLFPVASSLTCKHLAGVVKPLYKNTVARGLCNLPLRDLIHAHEEHEGALATVHTASIGLMTTGRLSVSKGVTSKTRGGTNI